MRPFIAIITWVIALVAAGAAFLTLGGELADTFSIPGTETQRVAEQMNAEVEGLDGGAARVVFTTDDGAPFTDAQKAQVSAALASATGIDHVTGVIDPFATQEQAQAQAQQLADAGDEIATGREQAAQGQEQLDAGIEQAQQAGVYD